MVGASEISAEAQREHLSVCGDPQHVQRSRIACACMLWTRSLRLSSQFKPAIPRQSRSSVHIDGQHDFHSCSKFHKATDAQCVLIFRAFDTSLSSLDRLAVSRNSRLQTYCKAPQLLRRKKKRLDEQLFGIYLRVEFRSPYFFTITVLFFILDFSFSSSLLQGNSSSINTGCGALTETRSFCTVEVLVEVCIISRSRSGTLSIVCRSRSGTLSVSVVHEAAYSVFTHPSQLMCAIPCERAEADLLNDHRTPADNAIRRDQEAGLNRTGIAKESMSDAEK